MASVEIVPVDLLDALDPVQADLARQWAGVFVADQAARFADGGSPWTLPELEALQRSPDSRRQPFAAVERDLVVGAGLVDEPLLDNLSTAQVSLATHPDHTRRGVGSALLAWAEQVVRRDGRAIVQVESESPVGEADPALGFALRHGYDVAQLELRSSRPLPGQPAWRERLGAIRDGGDLAATLDPTAYRIETVLDVPPSHWFDGLALLYRRMSTDVPLGNVHQEEEEWDAARVERTVRRLLGTGRRFVTAAALDRAGTMVAFSELAVSAGTPHLAYQGSTLVLREHRGHRIGLRVKAASTLGVLEHLPRVTSIRTWNAEENAPMLAVNHALGYVTDAHLREWQKRLPDTPV